MWSTPRRSPPMAIQNTRSSTVPATAESSPPALRQTRLPTFGLGRRAGLSSFDHVVGNVEEGRLDEWVEWYEKALGFTEMRHFEADQISTEFSALRSTVVWNGASVTMPINEPAPGRRKSQIQEYLESYGGPGVQHVAMATPDIVRAVDELRRRGVRFLVPPATYYENARARCDRLELPWADLERLGHPRRHRRRGLPASGFHGEPLGPADALRRDHPARGCNRVRRGELQGAVRGDRAASRRWRGNL